MKGTLQVTRSVSAATSVAMIPFSLIICGLVCATEVPVGRASIQSWTTFFLAGIESTLEINRAVILYFIYTAIVLLIRPESSLGRRMTKLLLAVPAFLISVYGYLVLTEYERFSGYPPFVIIYTLLALYLMAWSLILYSSGGGVSKSVVVAAAVTGLAGFMVSYVLNRMLFPLSYETLHVSTSMVSFLLLNTSLACVFLLLAEHRDPGRNRIFYFTSAVLGIHVLLLAGPLASTEYCGEYRSLYVRYGVNGPALASRPDTFSIDEAAGVDESVFDGRGEHLFSIESNLPVLPRRFKLKKYHILLITVEALRYRDTSFGDTESDLTGNLRKFAEKDAVLFTRAYAPAPGTLQSFSSIFSMTYPSFSRIRMKETRWHGELPEDAITVADVLVKNKYETYYAGHNFKKHFSKGGLISGLHQGFRKKAFVNPPRGALTNPNVDIRVLGKARSRIKKYGKRRKRSFGWVFFESPHYPYLKHYEDMPYETKYDLYRQEIRYVDEQLGQLFDFLRSQKLMRKTIIIISGDHGEAFGEHRTNTHADIYNETMHVPLLIHVPGMKPSVVDGPVSLSYVFPWLFLKGPRKIRNAALERIRKDVAPMMARTDNAVVLEMLAPEGVRFALVFRDYKVLFDGPSGLMELYDLEKDPLEKKNIYKKGTQPSDRMKKLVGRYLQFRSLRSRALSEL